MLPTQIREYGTASWEPPHPWQKLLASLPMKLVPPKGSRVNLTNESVQWPVVFAAAPGASRRPGRSTADRRRSASPSLSRQDRPAARSGRLAIPAGATARVGAPSLALTSHSVGRGASHSGDS